MSVYNGFSHWKWWCFIAMLVITRGYSNVNESIAHLGCSSVVAYHGYHGISPTKAVQKTKQCAVENDPLSSVIHLWKMIIFDSHVSLPQVKSKFRNLSQTKSLQTWGWFKKKHSQLDGYLPHTTSRLVHEQVVVAPTNGNWPAMVCHVSCGAFLKWRNPNSWMVSFIENPLK